MGLTEIILVATLHQIHAQVPNYGYKDLSNLIKSLNPAALVVELQQSEIEAFPKAITDSKVEYNEAILPLAQSLKIPLHPLEVSGKEREEILKVYEESWKKAESNPSYPIFSTYVDLLMSQLMSYWKSAADVNSDFTIESFRLKHMYQEKLFSVDTPSWQQWNNKFLESILRAAKAYKGKRIVVTVGAEHIYWLNDHLQDIKDIRIIKLKDVLGSK